MFKLKEFYLAILISVLGLILLRIVNSPSLALRGDRRDHISQLSSSLILDCVGFDLFRKAPLDFLEKDQSPTTIDWGKQNGIPGFELFKKPECTSKPISLVWPQIPRPYGPGIFLLLKPIAFLWNQDILEFRTALYAVFFIMLLGGSLSAILFRKIIFSGNHCVDFWSGSYSIKSRFGRLTLKDWILNLFSIFFSIDALRWALNGQFDSISVLILLMAFYFFQKKQFEKTLFFMSLCFFFQFRALFWAPVVLVSIFKLVQQWKNQKNHNLKVNLNSLLLISTLIIGVIGFYTFAQAYAPIQKEMITHITNPLFIKSVGSFKLGIELILGLALLIYFLYRGGYRWLNLPSVQWFWIICMLLQMPYVLGMHALFIIPILTLPFISEFIEKDLEKKKYVHSLLVFGLYYSLVAGTIFTNNPLEFNAIKELSKALSLISEN